MLKDAAKGWLAIARGDLQWSSMAGDMSVVADRLGGILLVERYFQLYIVNHFVTPFSH
jgi:hypothetical protein